MILSKVVAAVTLLVAMVLTVMAVPALHERHIIHAPIKFKIIHHYKIKKIPIIIKKHVHRYHKPQEEVKHFVEDHDEGNEHEGHSEVFHHAEDKSPVGHYQQTHHETPEEDYEEHQQSKEEQYDDYEYE